jgi:hypothetical protein
MVTAILLNFIMGYTLLFWSAMVETLGTPSYNGYSDFAEFHNGLYFAFLVGNG